jgi:hypothetical protein
MAIEAIGKADINPDQRRLRALRLTGGTSVACLVWAAAMRCMISIALDT